jgi:hypothetical protein
VLWIRAQAGSGWQMGFSARDRALMMALKGVGATVVGRLEQIGFSSFTQLAEEDAAAVTKQISQMMGSTCWHNSPQARASIQAIIDLARRMAEQDAS